MDKKSSEIEDYLISNLTTPIPFKLNFNHPVKAVYPGLSQDDINNICKLVHENTKYKSLSFPSDIFHKYAAIYLLSEENKC
jgi:hypothetical protein